MMVFSWGHGNRDRECGSLNGAVAVVRSMALPLPQVTRHTAQYRHKTSRLFSSRMKKTAQYQLIGFV
jgi:hypothetical protein